MRYKAALMSCAALVAATCLLSKIGDTILNSGIKHDAPLTSAAPVPAPAVVPVAVPEASAAVSAPGGPIAVSTGPMDDVTPTTLGTLPPRF